MALIHASSPHIGGSNATNQVMLYVVLATLPAFAMLCYAYHWAAVSNLLIAISAAWLFESAMLKIRAKPIVFHLKDNSALVTGVLLGLALPPASAWWLIVIAVGFAIVFGKHLYGGLGQNPFNPAMLGYVLVLISFTVEMSRWLTPYQSIDVMPFVFGGQMMPDAITSATLLDHYPMSLLDLNRVVARQADVWIYVNFAFLVGGLLLLLRRIITWHIPCSFLLGLLIPTAICILFGSLEKESLLLTAFSGATMMGAFFIATDPVSAATSPRGRLLYGFLIGLIIFIIRQWGGYPDGVAFAVLLMNIAAPSIDYFTRPVVYGHKQLSKGEH